MKNSNENRKTDYYKMKHKLYKYVLAAFIAAVVVVMISQNFVRGFAGNWTVAFLKRAFRFNNEDALMIYQKVIRNNINVFIYIAVALCFFLLCRVLLSRFMRYFDEVNAGIDALTDEVDAEIHLSPEIAFIEQKLSVLKQTLEKREQNAKLAEQRKNDLVMYLAHDIKTPLTSVIGYLSLLDEARDMPTEQRAKYVHISLDKAYRLEQLINEFFEITRYNLQTITLSKGNIDLYYMLVQMADEFYPLLSASGKQAVIHASEDLTVYGDSDKLARVFNNILKNAVAYSPDNSVIDIKAATSGGIVTIAFTNVGTIPKDKLTTIFEKFYRLDSARSSDTGGAGLGLAVAKEIVVLHGGRIYADSKDNCTIFTVELPVNET